MSDKPSLAVAYAIKRKSSARRLPAANNDTQAENFLSDEAPPSPFQDVTDADKDALDSAPTSRSQRLTGILDGIRRRNMGR